MGVMITATEVFPRRGVRGIEVTFKDTDLSLVTPTAIDWTLTNRPGRGIVSTTINSRDAVVVTPASSITIVLNNLDLDFLTAEGNPSFVDRALLVHWTYNSATLGNGVADYFQYNFTISNFAHLVA